MQGIYDAHPLTIMVVAAAMMVTPFHALATFVFSGASPRRGLLVGGGFLVFGAVMTWVCLADIPARLGPGGGAIVGAAWVVPSAVLVAFRRRLLAEPLDQRWLIGLQVWRVIGALFLLEMTRGHIPRAFAYPAGLGDIAVGVLAAVVVISHRRRPSVARGAVIAVFALGIADFASAFFFGNILAPGPLQLIETSVTSRVLQYPTGMIPLFLVPYAIFFHTLSLLTLLAEPRDREAPGAAARPRTALPPA